jgi:hypothetical protein
VTDCSVDTVLSGNFTAADKAFNTDASNTGKKQPLDRLNLPVK